MKNIIVIIPMCLLGAVVSYTQPSSVQELIKESIQFHDSKGQWASFQHRLNVKQENPQNQPRYRKIYLDQKNRVFKFESDYPEGKLEYEVSNNKGKALWSGSIIIPDTIASKYRVSDERAIMYRNYYSYLYGLPMKLNDPGTILHDGMEEVSFHGRDFYKITVSYDATVGSDTWHFYFDRNTYALGAYEFWKKEPGDGEYILLEGLKELSGIKLPLKMAWYMSQDDRWLGTDILE